MHKHIAIEVGIDEDNTNTLVHAVLDMGGKVFNATGTARRNPSDPCIPVVGEELALARALGSLENQIIDEAYQRIDTAPAVAG